MKLALKVTAAAILGALLVLVVDGFISARRDVEQFESDIRRDQLLLGNLLGTAVEEAYLRDGYTAAERVVVRAGRERDGISIRLIGSGQTERAKAPDGAVEALAGEPATRTTVKAVITYVPLELDDRPAVLELSESVGDRDRYITRTMRWRVATTLALAVVLAVFELIAGAVLLGRPLRKLVEHARRIGAGELHSKVELRQADEIGELAQEMNQMARDLLGAQGEIASEAAARIEAMEQLRHAERLTTVGKLAAGVAHELGTPLNVIGARAKLIQQGDASAGDAASSARVISEQAERMTKIIRQLLEFARPRKPSMAQQELRPIVEQTLALLDPMARKRNVELGLVPGTAPVSVWVDASQLQQVLTNLLVNAIQASPEGGEVRVELGIEDDPEGRRGAYAYVRVADSGIGINPESMPHLFEPFYTTKEVGEGTGLGLSVSHGIVQEHGGFFRVRSQPGAGASFTAYLPRAA